jgi:hypothetical protein
MWINSNQYPNWLGKKVEADYEIQTGNFSNIHIVLGVFGVLLYTQDSVHNGYEINPAFFHQI